MKTRLRPSRSPSVPAFSVAAREQEGVGVDHPLEVGEGGVEVPLDARQRDIDDRDVEEEHEDGDANDDEGPPLPLHSLETT